MQTESKKELQITNDTITVGIQLIWRSTTSHWGLCLSCHRL